MKVVSECIIFCVFSRLTAPASVVHNTKVVKITKHFIQIQAVLKNYTVKPTNMKEKETELKVSEHKTIFILQHFHIPLNVDHHIHLNAKCHPPFPDFGN